MRLLFFILAVAYLAVGFSVIFLEGATRAGRILILFLFGPFITAYENIKLALRK